MLSIRPLNYNDLGSVVAIETQAYPFPWSHKTFEDSLKGPGYRLVGLFNQDELLGYAVYIFTLDEAQLLNIALHPSQQGQGYSKMLMEYLLQECGVHQINTIFLEVRPSNTSALALYQSFGFEQIGIRKGYYPALKQNKASASREDAWVFALKITY